MHIAQDSVPQYSNTVSWPFALYILSFSILCVLLRVDSTSATNPSFLPRSVEVFTAELADDAESLSIAGPSAEPADFDKFGFGFGFGFGGPIVWPPCEGDLSFGVKRHGLGGAFIGTVFERASITSGRTGRS